jgi:hypothetical protein
MSGPANPEGARDRLDLHRDVVSVSQADIIEVAVGLAPVHWGEKDLHFCGRELRALVRWSIGRYSSAFHDTCGWSSGSSLNIAGAGITVQVNTIRRDGTPIPWEECSIPSVLGICLDSVVHWQAGRNFKSPAVRQIHPIAAT